MVEATTKKIIPINLTPGELAEMEDDAKRGELPPNAVAIWHKMVEDNVFGHDHKRDRKGRPIEQGIGSRGRETRNHFDALKRSEQLKLEPPGSYDAAVAEIWKRDPKRAEKLQLPKPQKAA